MPSFSVGFAQVEDRLRSVRRRLNLLIVQDAVYLAGSGVAAAAALLSGIAVWRGVSFPLDVPWLAGAAVAVAGAGAALRMHRRWLSREAVVHLADRRAELDDRLATLLLDAPRVRPSGLHTVLLEQILAAAPRWDVDRLAPRRVPRSLFVLAAALAALIVTAYFARPPAIPTSTTAILHPQGRPDAQSLGQPHPAGGGAAGATEGQGASGTRASERLAGSASDVAQMAVAAFGDLSDRRNGAAGYGVNDGRDGDRSADPLERAGAAGDTDAATSPGTMPPSDRDALQKRASASAADGAGTDARGNTPAGDPARAADRSTGNGAGARRDGTGSPPGPPSSPSDRSTDGTTGNRPGTGSAAAGGAPGGAATGLFAAQASGEAAHGNPRPMPVALGAFSTLASTRSDPQRPDSPGNALPNAGAPHPALSLPDEQIPDAPLQKADIAPEHEPLIRRIFTPDE